MNQQKKKESIQIIRDKIFTKNLVLNSCRYLLSLSLYLERAEMKNHDFFARLCKHLSKAPCVCDISMNTKTTVM